jgi:hypothetical protein
MHYLINKHNLMPHKATLAESFSSGRTQHTRELDFREAGELIKYLESFGKSQPPVLPIKGDANNLRRKVLSICHNMQWYARDTKGQLILKGTTPVLDYQRIDAFCIKSSPEHKPLQQHTAAELPMLITIFERVKKSTTHA